MRDLSAFSAVAALHLALLALFLRDTLPATPPARPAVFLAVARQVRPPPPAPAPALAPVLAAPVFSIPMPDFTVADAAAAPHAPARSPHPGQRKAQPHPAEAADGLDIAVTASATGGGGARAALADFEAGVRSRIAAAKRQPSLAKALRNTCLINYRITLDRTGRMVSFHIDPCTVAAINQAARDAVAGAGPFPPPPDFGAGRTDVHGSLVFEP